MFGDFLMADVKEQRVNIMFCLLLGKSAAEYVAIHRGAYKGEVLSQARVYECFSRFKSGRMPIEDDPDRDVPRLPEQTKTFKKSEEALTGISGIHANEF